MPLLRRQRKPVMEIGPGTRILQYAAYTFDVSIQDIWNTLQRGGITCAISDEERMSID